MSSFSHEVRYNTLYPMGHFWGEGVARYFSVEVDSDADGEQFRLVPMPGSFICPITHTIMEDPVMTADGCVYERSWIQQWIDKRQQQGLDVTSPTTNLPLTSLRLVSVIALKRAIETYMAQRPELRRRTLTGGRLLEEQAKALRKDLGQREAENAGLRSSLAASQKALAQAQHTNAGLEKTCARLQAECQRRTAEVEKGERQKTSANKGKESELQMAKKINRTLEAQCTQLQAELDRVAGELEASRREAEARACAPSEDEVQAHAPRQAPGVEPLGSSWDGVGRRAAPNSAAAATPVGKKAKKKAAAEAVEGEDVSRAVEAKGAQALPTEKRGTKRQKAVAAATAESRRRPWYPWRQALQHLAPAPQGGKRSQQGGVSLRSVALACAIIIVVLLCCRNTADRFADVVDSDEEKPLLAGASAPDPSSAAGPRRKWPGRLSSYMTGGAICP